jgi:predicted RecB family nuclease
VIHLWASAGANICSTLYVKVKQVKRLMNFDGPRRPTRRNGRVEWFADTVMVRWKSDPAMHIYHFTPYEPSALKRLMGRYASREEEIDRMLRAGLFIDLHTVLKRAVRAGVEQYSLKALELIRQVVGIP